MDFSGRYEIAALPEIVWQALNDPIILQSCIPGCEQLTRRGDNYFDAVAALRIGPLKASFRVVIEQCEIDPPHRCLLKGEGRGGVAGFGRGEAEVLLAPAAQGTLLTYTARASIGGRLAQVGRKLIDGAARQIADDFFARFAEQVSVHRLGYSEEFESQKLQSTDTTNAEAANIRRDGVAPEIWVIGLIGVIIILLVLFGIAL
ncbi:MAG TPA: carbon monoxide dehydrogenase subunit G [Rhizomicrobium sp.]|jgi:hypothetical protein